MTVTARRVVLFLIGLFLAVFLVGYGSGVLRFGDDAETPQDIAARNSTTVQQGTSGQSGASDQAAPSGQASTEQQAAAPSTGNSETQSPVIAPSGLTPPASDTATGETKAEVHAPSFDILRVEPDGSTVVAGRAASGESVELVSGSTVLGKAVAGPSGDFAIVLDQPLQSGDHSLVLRASGQGGVATSVETAIVSVPKDSSGQVLAMVEQPGAPSRLITVPEAPAGTQAGQGQSATAPAQTMAPAQATTPSVTADAPSATGTQQQAQQPATGTAPASGEATQQPASQGGQATASSEATGTAPAGSQPAAGASDPAAPSQTMAAVAPSTPATETQAGSQASAPAVEAVEIEGSMIFVAGRAAAGSKLRVYANDLLLGDATASPDGRFLVETSRELPVGSYTVRVDVLGPDGSVIARAAVPFEREPGENVAAVAPADGGQQSGSNAGTATAPSGSGSEPAASGSGAPATSSSDTTGSSPATTTAPSEERLSGGEMAASSAAATAPALKAVQGAVIIRRGDSLWRISRRAYGQGVRYSTIYLANQDQIQNPNRIWPGQVFRMPETTPEGDRADMNKLGDQATTQP